MPRYSNTAETRDGVTVYVLREGERARAEIAPALGNNCFVFETQQPVLETVAWEDFLHKPTSYGIPLLFPYPNRLRNSEFAFQGQTYRVNRPQHGFVRHKAWRVVEASADDSSAWLVSAFDADEEILAQFPFPFRVEVKYTLREGALTLEFTAVNTGTDAMPCGFGIHPYFRWPEQSRLQIPAQRRWELRDSLPTGKLLDVAGDYDLRQLRDTDGLQVDDIYTAAMGENARCLLTDDEQGTQTVVEFSTVKLPHIVAYTAPAPRRALCIEPMSCPTDAFNLQAQGVDSDVIVLKPQESVGFRIRITTEQINGETN